MRERTPFIIQSTKVQKIDVNIKRYVEPFMK